MNLVNRITCPTCRAPLKSVRGVRVGRKIKCVKCEIAFTVRAEDAEQAEGAGGVNAGRLCVVLAGALAFLGGGGGLAYYCFANSHVPPQQVVQADDAKGDDDVDPPAAPSPTHKATAAPGALSSAEQRAVDNAIANGAWFLKDHMLPTGTWGEDIRPANVGGVGVAFAALPALTLLECGVPGDDPVVQKAAAFVRQHVGASDLAMPTYQRALAILFLDRLGEKQDEDLIRYLALCLMAAQHPTEGAWTYGCPTLDRKRVPKLLQMLKNPKKSFADWRRSALQGIDFGVGEWDNSNTQFAVLALWVAQRHGVPIAHTSDLVEKHFRNTQRLDERDPTGHNVNLGGSWLYDGRGNSSAWPSMTCSGLLALAVAHGVADPSRDKQAKPKDDIAIQRALAMLTREIDRPGEGRPFDFYFLWSLERVGVLYNLPKIGGKDWYAWGRKPLLTRQQKDGSWTDGNYWGSNNILDTCFALLFLKQANLAKDLTNKLELLGVGSGAPAPTVQAPTRKE